MVSPAEGEPFRRVIYFKPMAALLALDEFRIDMLVSARFDKTRPMGNIASDHASAFVLCALVGRWSRVAPLVPERVQWLDKALSEGECDRFGESPSFDRANLLSAKGLCRWLMQSDDTTTAWAETLDAHEKAMFEPGNYAKQHIATLALDDFMLLSLLAEQPARGIAMYDRLREGKQWTFGGSRPRDWGYAACLQQLQYRWSGTELHAAGRRMLRRHLDSAWLGCGQHRRGAMWLHAVHGLPSPELRPLQVLMRAYDDMPDIEAPPGALLQV